MYQNIWEARNECVKECDFLVVRENSFIFIDDQSSVERQTSRRVKTVSNVSDPVKLSSCLETKSYRPTCKKNIKINVSVTYYLFILKRTTLICPNL